MRENEKVFFSSFLSLFLLNPLSFTDLFLFCFFSAGQTPAVLVLDDVPCIAPADGIRADPCASVLTGTNITERIVSALVFDWNGDGAEEFVLGGQSGKLYFFMV